MGISLFAMAGDAAAEEMDIYYVHLDTFDKVKEKLKSGGDITEKDVKKLAPDFDDTDMTDEAMMTPVDMRGVGEDFDDVEAMISKLGPKGACEAFVKAEEYLQKLKIPD